MPSETLREGPKRPGAATINNEIKTVDELLRAADSALYRAKRTGRGRTASVDDLPAWSEPAAAHRR